MSDVESGAFSRTAARRGTLTRIVLLAAVALIVVALVPRVREWRAREARIAAAQQQLAALANAVANQAALDSIVQEHEADLSRGAQRVLRSRSRPLAASALQSLVQELAESSNVTVGRLDVANLVGDGDVPIAFSANGDIFGLAELLRRLRGAPYLLIVDKLQVQNNSALRGAPDVLQIALSLHAPVIVQ